MRILYCITRSDTIGGASVHVGDMASWMMEQGHEVRVLFGGRGGAYADYLDSKSVPWQTSPVLDRRIAPLSDVRAVRDLAARFKEFEPALVSLHSSKAGFLGRLAARIAHVPALFTAHGWSFTEGISPGRAAVYRRLERWAAPLAGRIITVSEYDRDLALAAGICEGARIVAIHNGMPASPLVADAGDRSRPVEITMVARLDEQKDHRTLIAALAALKEESWILNLVGDGPLTPEVIREVEAAGLSDRVRFLGLRHDVDALLADSHIFVLASNWEGFPRSILEAMRAGLPVVATGVGGVAESVEEDVTGCVVPRGDVDRLSGALLRLIQEPELRGRMGTAAKARFEDAFRFEQMARKTLSVYRQVLDGSAAGEAPAPGSGA